MTAQRNSGLCLGGPFNGRGYSFDGDAFDVEYLPHGFRGTASEEVKFQKGTYIWSGSIWNWNEEPNGN